MKVVGAILLVVLAAALLALNPGEAVVSCGDMQSSLSPCLPYLTGGGEPTESCYSSVKTMAVNLQSQADRQTVCNCMKSAASRLNVKYNAASSLPGKCGISVGVSISPDTDCSQVS